MTHLDNVAVHEVRDPCLDRPQGVVVHDVTQRGDDVSDVARRVAQRVHVRAVALARLVFVLLRRLDGALELPLCGG